MLQVTLLCLLLGSVHPFTLSRNIIDKNKESSRMDSGDWGGSVSRVFEQESKGNATEEDELGISALLEKANKNLGKHPSDPEVRELDIAVGYGLQNAAPCTAKACRWPKNKDGNVYVPYVISKLYSPNGRATIEEGLRSFEQRRNSQPVTCIRFRPRNKERDFLIIQSLNGCYSNVGRQGGKQVVSLHHVGCLSKKTIQHEMLHILGFHHEHSRSDRDQYVKILKENIEDGEYNNFHVFPTNNLNTSYDYNSIMQYGRFFFSKNDKPTILPIPNNQVAIGRATKMSENDILRVKRLYQCCTYFTKVLCFFYSKSHTVNPDTNFNSDDLG